MDVEHVELGLQRRVTDRQPHQEAVALRLGQGIGALELDRVLRGDDEEGHVEHVGRAVDGDGALLHRLEHGRLGLRPRPVDLVAQDDVGEDRAGLELEVAPLLVVDRHTRDVAGQQVGGELHATHAARDRPGDGLGQQRLPHARHVLDEDVALGQQRHQSQPHDLGLALDHRLDVLLDAGEGVRQLTDRGAAPSIHRHTGVL